MRSPKLFIEPAIIHKNNETNDKFYRISMHTKKKQLRNKNHTEDWALGCHLRDNDLVN